MTQIDPIVERLERAIATHGWGGVHVFPNDTTVEPPYAFTYTVGLWPGHPELIVLGLGHQQALAVLTVCVERIQTGTRLEHDTQYALLRAGYSLTMRQVSAKASRDLLRMAHRLSPHDDPPAALQVVWPDEVNRYPWEAGYDDTLPQHILGVES